MGETILQSDVQSGHGARMLRPPVSKSKQ
jgi:hypothetical protein